MIVRQLMSRDPITIGPDDTVAQALEQMLRYDVRELPVVADSSLIGIVTDRDVKSLLGPGTADLDERRMPVAGLQASISELMSERVETLLPTVNASEACRLLVEYKVGAMPVVDLTGELLGICSVTDLLAEAARLFEREE